MCFCSGNNTNGGSIDGKLNLLCSLLCLFYTFWVYFSAAGTSQVTQVWWRLLIWYLSSLSVVSIGIKTDPPPTTTNVHRSSSSQNPAEVQGDFQTVWIKVSCHSETCHFNWWVWKESKEHGSHLHKLHYHPKHRSVSSIHFPNLAD